MLKIHARFKTFLMYVTKNLTGPDYKRCCSSNCQAGSGIVTRICESRSEFAEFATCAFSFPHVFVGDRSAPLPSTLYNFRAFAKASFPDTRTSIYTHIYCDEFNREYIYPGCTLVWVHRASSPI